MGDIISNPETNSLISIILNSITVIFCAVITGYFGLVTYKKKKKTSDEERVAAAEKKLEEEKRKNEMTALSDDIKKCTDAIEASVKSYKELDNRITQLDQKVSGLNKRINDKVSKQEETIELLVNLTKQNTLKYTALMKSSKAHQDAINRSMYLEDLNMQLTNSTSNVVIVLGEAISSFVNEQEKTKIQKAIDEHKKEVHDVIRKSTSPIQPNYIDDYLADIEMKTELDSINKLENSI